MRVFAWVNDAWFQHGDDIGGEVACDSSGTSIALSSDGNTLAVGALYNTGDVGHSVGHVRVVGWT